MRTKDFKSTPAEEDDVEDSMENRIGDDVEMTGEGSREASRVDEDPV